MSVEPAEVSEALRKRLGVGIRFVCDQRGVLMDALRIRHRDGLPPPLVTNHPTDGASRDIFMTTSFLVDEDGAIRWIYRPDTYRVRAPVREVLRAIDALG